MATDSATSSTGNRRERHHGGPRPLGPVRIILLVIAAIIPALIIWFSLSAAKAVSEVKQAAKQVAVIQGAIGNNDSASLEQSINAIADHIKAAHAQTSQPIWTIAGAIPYYGDDIRAVSSSMDAMNTLATDGLPHLAKAGGLLSLKDVSVSNGTVTIPNLAQIGDEMGKAQPAVDDANQRFQTVDGTHIPQLTRMLEDAQEQFGAVASAMDAATSVAKLMPSMMNVDGAGGGARTYVILAQNNAELRGTGGIDGSWGSLTIDGGKLTLNQFISNGELPWTSQPVIPLTNDEIHVFGDVLARMPQNPTLTPDFPRSGQIAKAMWENKFGGTVDGVIAVDPIMLQNVLKVVGDVSFDFNGRTFALNGDNTAQMLLNQVYFDIPDQDQEDAFFPVAAGAAFDRILHANANPVALVKALSDSVSTGHVYLWSAHEDEQQEIVKTSISGALSTDPQRPQAGVYFADGSGSKLGWYVKRDITAVLDQTLDDGSSRYNLNIDLANTVSDEKAATLPPYVTINRYDDSPVGSVSLIVYVYAPAGGRLESWTFPDGGDFDSITTHDGLTVGVKQIVLKPGENYQIRASLLTAPGNPDEQEPMELRTTPSSNPGSEG